MKGKQAVRAAEHKALEAYMTAVRNAVEQATANPRKVALRHATEARLHLVIAEQAKALSPALAEVHMRWHGRKALEASASAILANAGYKPNGQRL